ncbi:MAG: hypothetical protein WBB06_03525 [Chitinophagaceae bacterium]
MKNLFLLATLTLGMACNNSKKEKAPGTGDTDTTTSPTENNTPASNNAAPSAGSASVMYSVADTARNLAGSVLVQKDKDKLSPGNNYLAVVTTNGSDGESFVLNFLFALKPGSYPVVGLSFTRNNQVFGGILGGKTRITNYKVNLTQCEDLGSNNLGGHKWKISGSVDEEVTIEAMAIMKMDKTHPADIKLNKIRFENLSFDDNWEEMLNKAMNK